MHREEEVSPKTRYDALELSLGTPLCEMGQLMRLTIHGIGKCSCVGKSTLGYAGCGGHDGDVGKQSHALRNMI